MFEEVEHGADVVLDLLGEGKGLPRQPTDALPEGVVEPLQVARPPSTLMQRKIYLSKEIRSRIWRRSPVHGTISVGGRLGGGENPLGRDFRRVRPHEGAFDETHGWVGRSGSREGYARDATPRGAGEWRRVLRSLWRDVSHDACRVWKCVGKQVRRIGGGAVRGGAVRRRSRPPRGTSTLRVDDSSARREGCWAAAAVDGVRCAACGRGRELVESGA